MERPSGPAFRFGDVVFDAEDGTLTFPDRRVDLTPKQIGVLRLLAAAAPRLVRREELLDRVWSDRAAGDAVLSQVVKELRQVLGDSAREPRYIATVARRGYRLVAGVTAGPPEDAEAPAHPGGAPGRGDASAADGELTPPTPPGVAGRPWRRTLVLWALASIAASAVVVLVLLRLDRTAARGSGFRSGPRRSVAVLGFRDLGPTDANAWIATALTEFVGGELGAGGRIRVAPAEVVTRVTRERGLSLAAVLERPMREPDRRALAVDLVVVGSYLVAGPAGGGLLRTDVRVIDAATGDTLVTVSDSATPETILASVQRLGASLRDRLGVGALTPGEEAALRASFPTAADAVRLYAEGLERMHQFNFTAARELLERAVAAQPGSAALHAALANAWSWLGDEGRELAEAKRALELCGSLPRAQQLAIEGRYRELSGERDRAIAIGRALHEFFPDDLEIGLDLAISEAGGGRLSEAEATLDSLRSLPPPLGDDPRIDLAGAWFSDDRLERKLKLAGRAARRASESGARLLLAAARIQQGEAWMGMGEQERAREAFGSAMTIREAAGDRWGVGKALLHLGRLHRARAELDAAERALDRFLAVSREVGSVWSQAEAHYELGLVAAERGRGGDSRRELGRALALFEEVGRTWGAARVRVAIAEVELDAGSAEAAAAAAEDVAQTCQRAALTGNEAAARIVLARAELARGNVERAQAAASRAEELLADGGDPSLAIRCAVATSAVRFAAGDRERGVEAADDAAERARAAGLVALALQARLAAATMRTTLDASGAGVAELAAVADEAEKLGLGRIAAAAASHPR